MHKEKKIGHCPKCQKPIFNGGIFMAAAQFKMRCSWCQTTLDVHVQPRVVVQQSAPDSAISNFGHDKNSHDQNGLNETEMAPLAKTASGLPGLKLIGYLYSEDSEASKDAP